MIRHLSAKIAAAYLGNNAVATTGIPDLITTVHNALASAALPDEVKIERQPPAVPVKKSITPDAVFCLECGAPQKMLKRHLSGHGLSIDEYRSRWSLPSDYPMVAPNYAKQRSQLAFKIGLGRKAAPGPVVDAEEPKAEEKPQYRYPASRWSKPGE